MQGVTEEQRRRMEANRLNALRRLEERKASWSSSNTTDFSSSQPTVDTMETSSQTTLPPTHSNVSAWDLMLSSSSSLSRVAKKSSSSDPTKTLGEDSRTADKKDVHKKRTKVNVEIQPPKTVVVSFSFSKELHEFMKTLRGTYVKKLSEFTANEIDLRLPPAVVLELAGIVSPAKPSEFKFPAPQSFSLGAIDSSIRDSLLPFQQDGVRFVVSRSGRALIADDMGLGKTIQAIAVASYYRAEWPLLIVVPSSLRLTWAEAFQQWLPSVSASQINVVLTGKDAVDKLVNIISYDLAVKLIDPIKKQKFHVVIVDESHYLKSRQSKRTKLLLPVLKAATRTLLLSGTPALSRPEELYPQLSALQLKLFSNFSDFALRYCSAFYSQFGMDSSGASNLTELRWILENSVMIRRLKKDVLKQLPPKRRQQIFLQIRKNKKELQKQMDSIGDLEGVLAKMLDIQEVGRTTAECHKAVLELWHDTTLAKMPEMLEYIGDLLECDRKFLLFAHHRDILDAFQEFLEDKKIEFIRIDGNTRPTDRQRLCGEFQSRPHVQVALLSITAACVGLTLTAADTVVFAQLYWNPGLLIQAEDRAHRIGQPSSVNVHYLLAKGTIDDRMWPMLLRKLVFLQTAGLCQDPLVMDGSVEYNPSQPSIDKFFASQTNVRKESGRSIEDGDDGVPSQTLQKLDTMSSVFVDDPDVSHALAQLENCKPETSHAIQKDENEEPPVLRGSSSSTDGEKSTKRRRFLIEL